MLAAADTHAFRRPDPLAEIHHIPLEHQAVDLELHDWGRWLKMRSWSGGTESPMFRLFRSSEARAAYGALTVEPTPAAGRALAVEEAVRQLGEIERELLRHWYVRNSSPWRVCKLLSIRKDELQAVLHQARSHVDERMAIDRKPG